MEQQDPTAANNYTWYRLYNDGWVEQGTRTAIISNNSNVTVVFPIEMADHHYIATMAQYCSLASDYNVWYYNQGAIMARTTTGMTLTNRRFTGNTTLAIDIMWQVSGMAKTAPTYSKVQCIRY